MFEQMTPEKIKADVFAALKSDLDRREGSFTDDMAGPLAVELYKMYQALEAVPSMIWVNEGSGPYLDLAAEDLGLPARKKGTKARALLWLTGAPGYLLPGGTSFSTQDEKNFTTDGAALLSERGEAEVWATAEKVGDDYNVGAEEIRVRKNGSRIKTVGNPEAAHGGTDPESDESIYRRIVDARQKPATSGNLWDYERWAREAQGIGFAKCTPLQYGPGTVGVLVVDEDRRPVDEAVVAACAAHIEQVRPIGAAVTVQSALALPIDVQVTVTIDASITVQVAQAKFCVIFEEYLRAIAFREQTVLYNWVGAMLLDIPGVLDYQELRVCGETENVTIGAQQVPVSGRVVLEWVE